MTSGKTTYNLSVGSAGLEQQSSKLWVTGSSPVGETNQGGTVVPLFFINIAMENFYGKDGFIWFTGVVEDRDDPDKLGRVRVRCVGYHTDDVTKIPTDFLGHG